MISGNYVNFAICEYYNDSIFTQLSQLIFTSLSVCGYQELTTYEKVHRITYQVILHFFSNHLELLFKKFESNLTEAIIDLLIRGMTGTSFDVQSDCCTCIDSFNIYVLDKLQSQNSMKHQELIRSVQDFCQNNNGEVFQRFLKESFYAVLFEENRNIWIYQKVLHSSCVIVNQ